MAVKSVCKIEGCGKTVLARGWCRAHYRRWYRSGDPKGKREPYLKCEGLCLIERCTRPVVKRGMCEGHYWRWREYGDANAGGTSKGEATAWLLAHVGHEGEGCLTWPFARFPTGYAKVKWQDDIRGAHRVMCRLAHGEPPSKDHEAAHSCGKGHEACIHPGHLRWATPSENAEDKREHGTMSRLTWDDIGFIRERQGAMSQHELAAYFGVSRSAINHIHAGRTWPR